MMWKWAFLPSIIIMLRWVPNSSSSSTIPTIKSSHIITKMVESDRRSRLSQTHWKTVSRNWRDSSIAGVNSKWNIFRENAPKRSVMECHLQFTPFQSKSSHPQLKTRISTDSGDRDPHVPILLVWWVVDVAVGIQFRTIKLIHRREEWKGRCLYVLQKSWFRFFTNLFFALIIVSSN